MIFSNSADFEHEKTLKINLLELQPDNRAFADLADLLKQSAWSGNAIDTDAIAAQITRIENFLADLYALNTRNRDVIKMYVGLITDSVAVIKNFLTQKE